MSEEAQKALLGSCAIVLGSSYLAWVVVEHLLRAGVGEITVLPEDEGSEAPVVVPAKIRQLMQEYGDVTVSMVTHHLDPERLEKVIDKADTVLDCLSNWQDKLNVSDACMKLGKPLVHTRVRNFEFQVYAMLPGKSACLRCVFADLGQDDLPLHRSLAEVCAEPIMGMAGGFQAMEALKLLARIGVTQSDELFHFDGLRRSADTVQGLRARPDCPDCGRFF